MMALNFGTSPAELAPVPRAGRVVFGTHDDAADVMVNDRLKLRGGEGVVVAVEAS
jgi:hypothetical protein